MELKIYGVRSSAPRPLTPADYRDRCLRILEQAKLNPNSGLAPEKLLAKLGADLGKLIGGNTPCLSTKLDSGHTLILDAGSGMYELGQELMQGDCAKGQGELHIFFSHIHLDRILGLQHFAPLFIPGNQIHFYFPEPNLELRLLRIQSQPYNEYPLDAVKARTWYHTVPECRLKTDCIQIGSAKIEYLPLLHPGSSYAWKIIENNKSLIYAGGGKIQTKSTNQTRTLTDRFFEQCSIAFLDARPAENYNHTPKTWGHNDYESAITLANSWRCEHLFLFNHPPDLGDHQLWSAFLKINPTQSSHNGLTVHLAREGQRIRIEPK